MWWFVAPALAAEPCDGVDNDGDGQVDEVPASIGSVEYPSLKAAVDAAVGGDTIQVCDSTVQAVDLVLGDRDLTLLGVGVNGPASLAGAQQVTAGDAHVRFQHLHLTNPSPGMPHEPALLVGEKAWVTLEDTEADGAEPAVEVQGYLEAKGSRFGTTPLAGSSLGAVLVQPGATASLGDSTVSGSALGVVMYGGMLSGGQIRGNQTGVYVRDAVAVVAGSVVTDNTADGIDGLASQVTLNEVKVRQNEGTGVYFTADDANGLGLPGQGSIAYSDLSDNGKSGLRTEVPVDLLDDEITGNSGCGIVTKGDLSGSGTNVTGNSSNRGAGLLVLAPVRVSGLRIAQNQAVTEGGGVQVDAGADGVTVLDHVVITDNVAGFTSGGVSVKSVTEVQDSAVRRNSAGSGGGALVASGKTNSLTSTCSSWGVRTDDNTPDDVVTDAGAWSIGTDDFRCDDGGCVLSAAACPVPGGDVLDPGSSEPPPDPKK